MPRRSTTPSAPARGSELLVGALLLAAMAAAVGLGVVYVVGGQVQLEGLLLGVACAALGVAVGLWAKRFMPQGPVSEPRPSLASTTEDRAAVLAELDRGERSVARRKVLAGLALGAVGALGAAVLLPFRSLGPFPLPDLDETLWGDGRRLVDEAGTPLRADDLTVGAMTTAFPEGASTKEELEAGQVVLVRVGPGVPITSPGRSDWAPDGHLAFSKVCTHAGCPVGLYQAETHQLVCPCHQSLFDVTAGATPVFGPATRALPQLPLAVRDGYLVATGGFAAPPGPGHWAMDR